MNGAITPGRSTAGNLRIVVEDYLTNGKYDPRKSQNKADDYKNARLTIDERRAVSLPIRKKRTEESNKVFSSFQKLVDKIPVPVMTNTERYQSLRRPPETMRHDTNKHQRNLRTPSGLMQTNKLNQNGVRKTSDGNSKLQLPKRVSGRNIRKEQASSQPCTI